MDYLLAIFGSIAIALFAIIFFLLSFGGTYSPSLVAWILKQFKKNEKSVIH